VLEHVKKANDSVRGPARPLLGTASAPGRRGAAERQEDGKTEGEPEDFLGCALSPIVSTCACELAVTLVRAATAAKRRDASERCRDACCETP
jgi:hypothetical protein